MNVGELKETLYEYSDSQKVRVIIDIEDDVLEDGDVLAVNEVRLGAFDGGVVLLNSQTQLD